MFASRRRLLGLAAGLALIVAFPGLATANHSWGGYHWARTSNPFTLRLGDNVSPAWDGYLASASSDWTQSTVLDTSIVPGSSNPRTCKATTGMVQVCDAKYGYNGWLGVAGIYITGGVHITKGYVKLNDSYFNTSTYDSPDWRQLVVCQEVGHTFGLDHQDTNFNNGNLGTCMDYTGNPAGPPSNLHPNQGDYDELLCIYDPASAGKLLSTSTHSCTGTGHLDSFNTNSGPVSALPGGSAAAPAAWGLEVARTNGGKTSVFVNDLGGGNQVVTFVIWA